MVPSLPAFYDTSLKRSDGKGNAHLSRAAGWLLVWDLGDFEQRGRRRSLVN